MTPLVSVVIPTYNRARDLERSLGSVLGQTVRDLEVVVVDNHSEDDTDAVVARFGDVRVTLLKIHNGGVLAKSRNLGTQRARGEYVAFLDSDDWWKPDKLERAMAAHSGGADLTYHDLHLVTHMGQRFFPRRIRTWKLPAPVARDLLLNGNAVPTSSVVVRRSLLGQVGGMTEERDMIAMEDYDCWLKVAKVTDKFVRLPGRLGYYWAGGGNTSSDTRELDLLDRFELRYRQDLASLGAPETPWWIRYGRGRAHYRLGNRDRAHAEFAALARRPVPSHMAMKTLFMRLLLALPRVAAP